jgi:UDP-glucose 4-epimerase
MKKGAHVTVLDDMSNGKNQNILSWKEHERFDLILGDIRKRQDVRQALKDVSVVFHQAAKVSVPVSVKHPSEVMEVNALGTAILLDECRRKDIDRIVVASSSSVYGDTPILPKKENMLLEPLSPYAASKLAQEKLAIAFFHTYGMETTALRYFNVFGPRQRSGTYAGVISIFIRQAINGEDLTIDGNGLQTRDFTFVDDVVKANLVVAQSESTRGKVYNVGTGKKISIEALAEMIIHLTNSDSGKKYTFPRPGDVAHSLADTSRLERDTGFCPRTTISDGLVETVKWVSGTK